MRRNVSRTDAALSWRGCGKLEDVRQQFEKERKRHRQERERDAATIEKLKRELDEEKKRLSVPGYEYECY